jgi:hypothetical protein
MNWTHIVIWLTRIFCAACGVVLCVVLASFGMRFLIGGLALYGLYVSLVFLHQLRLSRARVQQGCAELLVLRLGEIGPGHGWNGGALAFAEQL